MAKLASEAGSWYNGGSILLCLRDVSPSLRRVTSVLRRLATMDTIHPHDFFQQALPFDEPDPSQPQKTCKGPCSRTLPATLEFFYCHKDFKDGLRPRCKQCMSEEQKRRQQAYVAPVEKQCTGPCGRTLPATLEYFGSNGGDSLYTQCKECKSVKVKESHQKPEVRGRAIAHAKYVYSTPEGKARVLANNRKWRQSPGAKEYIRNYRRIYRTRPEVIKKRRIEGIKYWARPEAQKRRLEWERNYLKQPEKRDRHRERDRVNQHTRRARKKSIDGIHTTTQIQEQLKRQKCRCYYAACGHAKFKKKDGRYVYHVEHTFPISRVGGADIPANDINYIVLACPECNMSKNDKFPWEWPEGGRLL